LLVERARIGLNGVYATRISSRDPAHWEPKHEQPSLP
jgi:hypothetical protein